MNFLEKPFNEYITGNAFINKKRQKTFKCLLWLPNKNDFDEPHLYLYTTDYQEHINLERIFARKKMVPINIDIPISGVGKNEVFETYLFKDIKFKESKQTHYAENWMEGYIKFWFPKWVAHEQYFDNTDLDDNTIDIHHTQSVLLKSFTSTHTNLHGETSIGFKDNISINNLEHLGIKSIETDMYIGDFNTYLLKIQTVKHVKNTLTLNRQIIPFVNFIFACTSFIERRKIQWYKATYQHNSKFIGFYKTRSSELKFQETLSMIYPYDANYQTVLEVILRNTHSDDIAYKTELCLTFITSSDHTTHSKIITWNTILEKIFKHHSIPKFDKNKEAGLQKLGIPIKDLTPLIKLINLRNEIVHADPIDPEKFHNLYHDWEILIQRTILFELGFKDLHKTDIAIKY